ncbi:NAD-dependent epimerase/dehydratase family protein [Gemmiger formicilis]|nr:NAD-dependent epimerase/dehydratase family protein [Gemmiger formicilis]
MAKLCAGQMSRVECQTLGMAHIWTRILSVYGPHDGPATMISGTIRKLLHGEKPALTAGIQQWDYLYAADAAAAFYALAVSGQDGRVYPLGSGTARPLKDYIEALRDAIDPALPLGLGRSPTARCRSCTCRRTRRPYRRTPAGGPRPRLKKESAKPLSG